MILHAKDVTVFLIGKILGSENLFLDEVLIRRWILPTLVHTGISRGTSPPRITIPANPHYIVPYGNWRTTRSRPTHEMRPFGARPLSADVGRSMKPQRHDCG